MFPRFAVVGNPIEHSLSPLIHEHFAKQTGKRLYYGKLLSDQNMFSSTIKKFFTEGGTGLNITAPFKEAAYSLADSVSLNCYYAKAANTLWLNEGYLCAENTDGIGFIRDITKYIDLARKSILVVGAGGAVRGILAPLLAANIANLTLTNRTLAKLNLLRKDLPKVQFVSLNRLKGPYDIIINATSTDLTEDFLAAFTPLAYKKTFCYDLAYSTTTPTAFAAWAIRHGCCVRDGLGMLVEQAAEAFFLWHAVQPDTLNVHTFLHSLRENSGKL